MWGRWLGNARGAHTGSGLSGWGRASKQSPQAHEWLQSLEPGLLPTAMPGPPSRDIWPGTRERRIPCANK